MRNIVKALIIIISSIASLELLAQRAGSDTTFVLKENIDGEQHAIFFGGHASKFYDDISRFTFDRFDGQTYQGSLDYLKKKNLTLTRTNPILPWTTWVTLKQYKGNFYVYKPCDFCFHFRQSVNDSTFIDWGCEGPLANKILSQKKINKSTYRFVLAGLFDEGGERELTIHVIDFKKGIAVFESDENKRKLYYLMIAADKVRRVPIIIHHCPSQKQAELKFSDADVKNLLNGE